MNEVREKIVYKKACKKGFNIGDQIGESSGWGKIFNIFCKENKRKKCR